MPGLDDLAWPHGPIADAERALADAFAARGAAILVGGSTVGILAALLALAGGRTVALGPTQHRSVYAGLVLAGAEPSYLPERTDVATGLSLGLDVASSVAELARLRPAAVIVAYPTYQGVASPFAEIARAAHAVGALVLADGAHGAHFGLDPRLPERALEAGADVAVYGLHKTLGALTQTALLAWADDALGPPLRASLRLLQSSSPSYLLMASADAVGATMANASRRWVPAIDRALEVRAWLGEEAWRADGPVAQDPSRLWWLPHEGTGGDLSTALRREGVEPEYADERGVLLLLGPGLRARHMPRLARSLRRARQSVAGYTPAPPAAIPSPPLAPDRPEAMRAALAASWESIPLSCSSGRQSADFIVPYPPGVPVVLPGAVMRETAIRRLAVSLAAGREVQGIGPGGTIRVVRTEGGASS